MSRLLLPFFVVCLLSDAPTLFAADSKINRSAQNLAKHLTATTPAKKANEGDQAKLRQRMIAAMEVMEDSYRTNGPTPESLIAKAMEFRPEMGGWEKMMTTTAVLSAWREANGRGLFNESGKFQDHITKGRGVGDKCTFELIVPAEAYPPGSNQLANLRLVTVEKKRAKDAELSNRELAYRGQLEKLVTEKERGARLAKVENGPKTNSVGRTAEESLALWRGEVEKAGHLAKELPNIRLNGRITGTPSHMTQERWRATAELANISKYPTEVTVETYLIGITDRKRDHYLMAKSSETVKLRINESRTIESYTRAQNSYKGKADDHDEVPKKERGKTQVRCRGFVMIVKHGDKIVAYSGSDQMMSGYANPENKDSPLRSLTAF